jgi:hypothetical protein
MRSITGFRAALTGSGTRPNLFQIVFAFPTLVQGVGAASGLVSMLAESSALPADTLGEIELPYQGRKTYYPGDRTFEPWTITIMNDENFLIRDAFELWLSALNSHVGNIRSNLAATPSMYCVDGYVQQYSKLDVPSIKQYKMAGAFPTEVGAMELDWGTNNTIEKFQVTLRYQWWEAVSVNGPTTDGQAMSLESDLL